MYIRDIRDGLPVKGSYLVTKKGVLHKKDGSPFLSLTLQDRSGIIQAKVWEDFPGRDRFVKKGDVIEVLSARGSTFRGRVELTIERFKPLPEGVQDRSAFLPVSPFDPEEMAGEILGLAGQIRDMGLKNITLSFLQDGAFMKRFKDAPAAQMVHHAYVGGLLEHTLKVTKLCLEISPHYEGLDMDLLISGSILHDIGKVEEIGIDAGFEYSDQGRLLGHIYMGAQMVDNRYLELPADKRPSPERLLLLKHIILSHHGEYELGSPRRPKIKEALLVHYIEDLDAKMKIMDEMLEKVKGEGQGPRWTPYSKYMERYFYLRGEEAEGGGPSPEGRRGEEDQISLGFGSEEDAEG